MCRCVMSTLVLSSDNCECRIRSTAGTMMIYCRSKPMRKSYTRVFGYWRRLGIYYNNRQLQVKEIRCIVTTVMWIQNNTIVHTTLSRWHSVTRTETQTSQTHKHTNFHKYARADDRGWYMTCGRTSERGSTSRRSHASRSTAVGLHTIL